MELQALMADPCADLSATGEVHVQQHGSRCQMWAPPEVKDPVLLHAPTRRSAGYFVAVRLRDGRFHCCRETGKFNGETFFTFMRSLRRTSLRTGRQVVVNADNAQYQHARLHKQWREEPAGDFALDYLPPRSPKLNPIERAWKLTRRRCLHNRYFAQLDDVIAAVEQESGGWTTRNETLRRLCAII
jgi:transposase